MRKLFRENFRRLAPAGLLLTLLFGALSVILSINRQPDVINIEEISFILYAFPYIGGVVLSLTGFSFLHSRAASDLYLGLPYRRRTLYTGVVLGILAWGGLILGLSLGLTWLCLSLRGCLFLRIHLLVLFVYWFIAFVLVAGAFILGQCFSGTRFFGFSWGMLVLCLPRYILGLLAFYITQTVGSVAGDFTSIWLQSRWNLATGPLMSFFEGSNSLDFYEARFYIYSLLLGAATLALGACAFQKRRAELSGSAAVTPAKQHLCSALVAFVPAFAGLILLQLARDDASVIAIFLVIGLLTYVGYELVASRSIKKSLTSLYWYGFSLLAGVLFLLMGVLGGVLYEKMIPTKPEQIASVQFIQYDTEFADQQYRLSRVKLQEERIRSLVCQALQTKGGFSVNSSGYAGDIYDYEGKRWIKLLVTLQNGMTLSLRCPMDEELQAAVLQNEQVQKVLSVSAMPRGKAVLAEKICMDSMRGVCRKGGELYEMYLREMENAPGPGAEAKVDSMSVWLREGLRLFEDKINIYRTQTPETARVLIALSREENGLSQAAWRTLWGEDYYIRDIGEGDETSIWVSSHYQTFAQIVALLHEMPLAEGTEKHLLQVYSSSLMQQDEKSVVLGSYNVFLAPDETQYQTFLTLMEKLDQEREKASFADF